MSLQVWLPLTKDLRQQGLSNITVTNNGATFNTNGKLGGCYSVDNVKQIGRNNCLNLGTTFSIAFWSKINSKNVDWGNIFKIYKDGADYIGMCLAYTTDANPKLGFHIYRNNGSNAREAVIDGYKEYSLNNWFHTVITVTPTKAIVYKDGVVFNTFTINKTFPSITNYSLWLGKNGIGNGLDCSINDFRIYNHCLSQTEVKELAKGLVLHYPLSDKNIESTTNLVTGLTAGGQTIINGTTVQTKGESNADTYFHIKTSALTSGATYSLSCYVTGLENGKYWSFGIGAQSGTNKCCSFVLYNGYNSCTFTLPSGLANATQLIWDDDTYNINRATTVMKVSGIQLEQKDHSTGFTPFGSSRNNSIAYDCSGLCNNGACTGTFTITNDTARYNASTIFTESPNAISFASNFSHLTTFTYNCWIKTNTAHNAFVLMGYQYGNNTSGSLALDSGTSKAGFHYYLHNGGQGDVTIGSNVNYYDNQWHMLTATYDGSKVTTYFDGVKTAEGSVSLVTTARTFSLNQPSGASGRYFKGQMSDARVYATVLSAEDILTLYHTAARIDNVGNTYVYQYIET